MPNNNSDDDDDDDDLFGGGSDSDDTAELIQQSKQGGGKPKHKPKPAKKPAAPKKKPDKPAGGLFDSDSSDDSDDDEDSDDAKATALLSKQQRMEALAAKKTQGQQKAPTNNNKTDTGYASGGSIDSADIQRTKDDDDFLDTTNEDADGVRALYAEQNFDDDDEEAAPKRKKKTKRRRDGQGTAEPDNPVDAVMQRMKKKKKQKKGKEELEDEVKVLLSTMDAAAESDRVALSEGRPGMERLKIHRQVFETLNQTGEFQTLLLEFDGLSTCKRWIELLPNGQLNNLTITTKMLDAVGKLPISSDDLKRSGFGKTVMSIGKHSQLPTSQKAVIRTLVERWTRPILKKSGTLKDYDPSKRRQHRSPASASATTTTSRSSSDSKQDDVASLIAKGKRSKPVGTQRVQVPFGKGFDFTIRPADRASSAATSAAANNNNNSGGVRKQLQKRMVEKSRAVGKNQRSANVSVEGRATK